MTVYVLGYLAPAAQGMAICAIGAQLASMNIGVAVGALRSYIGKIQSEMTMGAIEIFMHFFKCETGCSMIESRRGLNGLQACRSMTVAA